MAQVVPPDFRAAQKMVLTAINDVERYADRLHHCRASAAHVVRRPCAILAICQDQTVIMMPAGQRFAAILEAALPVTDQLADGLRVDVAVSGSVGK